MKNKGLLRRVLAIALTVAMLASFAIPAGATGTDNVTSLKFEKTTDYESGSLFSTDSVVEEEEEPLYAETDEVRVSIVLESESTIAAGFSTKDIAQNASAVSYRESLKKEQEKVTDSIEKAVGTELDVAWNLTLAANIISANVQYGQIEAIAKVPGVKDVVIETRYEPQVVDTNETADPNMATSGTQVGSNTAWAAGYTGAGSRVAIIDTGIDVDHQSFSAAGLNYSLSLQAAKAGMSAEAYIASLDLLDAEEIAEVADQLNVNIDASQAYISSKIAYGYNYVDGNYNVTHLQDTQGEHGSHVEGIAAANAYIPNGDGTFASALDTVFVQGVAPDAQIITMKVFGASGGAYDSDYMVAIEDAIILGADSINLSLGSGNPGFSRNSTAAYQEILDALVESDTVVTMSAGNSGHWADNSNALAGYLYGDDVSMHAGGSPGSFTNSLGVASVDNDGATGEYLQVGEDLVFYTQTNYSNAPMSSIAGERQYVLIDGFGTDEDWTALEEVLTGKIAVCSRGSVSFYQKAEWAVDHGAIATIIYNNTTGTINMDLSDYTKTAPCVSVTQATGALLKAAATRQTTADGVEYYLGTMTVSNAMAAINYGSEFYTMSTFSAYGVPGSLKLKPEITAPGGSIYSVYGANADTGLTAHDQYEVMSGTSMAAPQATGMAAVIAQYIRENGLAEKTDLTVRGLVQSLLMSTSVPMVEEDSGYIWSVLRQGSGLANVGNAVSAQSYIKMGEDATESAADGKVKVELGDDPGKTGEYSFSFSVNNLSDVAKSYTLSTDLYTQDLFAYAGYLWLDTWTTPLAADVSYIVDGETFVPSAPFAADVDKDGDTDADDAYAALYYAVIGETAGDWDLNAADVDGNGEVTSYDAHLILSGMRTEAFSVAAGGSVNVVVNIQLTAEQKAYLDELYANGAYVEGYTYVEPVSTTEGEIVDVTHSIPILGFYGNWSDASMYDKQTYAGYLYGDQTPPYTGIVQTNNLIIKYAGDSAAYYQIGNPYVIEESYPEGREAINSADTLYQWKTSMIRNAGAVLAIVTDESGEILYQSSVTNQAIAAYYYTNGGVWRNTSATLTMNKKVSSLGVEEGDVINVSMVAIPEYYETDGVITAEQAAELIQSGTLGDGAYLTTTLTVDNTAPELLAVEKDLLTGNLTIAAQDNNYIAFMAVLNKNGSKILAGGVPEQTEANELVACTIDLEGIAVGEKCTILVADYAGNEAAYVVDYGGEPVDYTGKMYGFTASAVRGSGPRWVEIQPEDLYYTSTSNYGGMDDVCATDLYVVAAEYVDGYVFFATRDGYLYAAEHDEWDSYSKVGSYADDTDGYLIYDMAYNYQDGKLYVLDATNTIYVMDTISGVLTKQYTITCEDATSSTYGVLRDLAIDDEGNFYSANHGSGSIVKLYTWTNADVEDGALSVTGTKMGVSGLYNTSNSSMAWDHNKDILYFGGAYGTYPSSDVDNELWVINFETGLAEHPNVSLNGQFRAQVVGLYVVPSGSQSVVPTDTAISIELNETELSLLKGGNFQLSADVYPWTLTDKSVSWSTSDASVAIVENGYVEAVGVGEATITATTNAAPNLTATCTVTVEQLPNVKLSGLVYDVDGTTYWSEFETDTLPSWTAVSGQSSSYIAGTLQDELIYVHDGGNMFGVDPDTFETTSFGTIASSWIWSDAAESPATEEGYFGRMIGFCNGGTFMEMLNPEEGTLSYWDLSTVFGNDPLATIAYAGSGTYDYTYIIWQYNDCPANFYYVMTEGGALYEFIVFTYTEGSSYTCSYRHIADTGLNLTGVANVTAGQYASMEYDEETGYLLLASYMEGETAQLYAIDPESGLSAKIGEFGDKVWPVVSLYQHERITDLTVKLTPTYAEIYEGDTLTLNAKVKMGETNQLTWTTSDATVATVDENGVVTGVGEGTAIIIATTVDTNSEGETVSASATIKVEGLINPGTTSVSAQIVTDEGAQWVTINTSNLAYTVDANADTTFTGAGAHSGEIYGTNCDFSSSCNIFKVDPSDGFAETTGSGCSADYAFLDATTAPAQEIVIDEDEEGNPITAIAFDYPIWIGNVQGLYMLKDFEAGSLRGWHLYNYYDDLAAVAYVGDTTYTYQGTEYPAHMYLALGADGTLYQMIIFATTYTEANGFSYTMSRGVYGNIGHEFPNYQTLTMTYVEFSEEEYGLLIGDSSQGAADLYYVSLAGEAPSFGKIGRIDGATAISGLYTELELGTGSNAIADQINTRRMVEEEDSVMRTREVVEEATEVSVQSNEATDVMTCSAAVPMDVAIAAPALDELEKVSDTVYGSLNAVTAYDPATETQNVTVDEEAQTVTVKVNASNSTNGKYTVVYDADVLTYVSASSNGEVNVINPQDGNVVVGYAFADASSYVGSVTFSYVPEDLDVTTLVTIITSEDGDDTTEIAEEVSITLPGVCDHSETELRNQKDATCTEEGYTGDVVCKICGAVITEGTSIPALGHKTELVGYKPATDAHPGYTGDLVCTICGEVIEKGEVIPAKAGSGNPYDDKFDEDEDETPVAPVEPEKPKSELPFIDVDVDDSFYEDVKYVYENGIMNGVSDTKFDPYGTLTRGMIVTTLYRLEGSPDVTFSGIFTDVAAGDWYANAVEWAAANGVVNGYGDGTFGPNDAVTREQLAAILYRYATLKGYDVTATADLSVYTDGANVSEYAITAVQWAVANDVLAPVGGALNATGNATRAQVAHALHAFMVNVIK